MRGVRFACEAPRTGWNGTKGEKRLENQLICQNRPNRDYPVPPLPAAREGRGSLELVEIFQMRNVARRFTPVCRSRCGTRGRTAAPAPGGLTGVWGRPLYVRLCVCRPIETTFPTGVWGRRRRALSRVRAAPAGGRLSPGEPGIARARRDLSNAVDRVQIPAGLSQSMRRPRADRGPGAGRFVRNLAHRPLRVVLLVQANRKDPLARNLAQVPESTL